MKEKLKNINIVYLVIVLIGILGLGYGIYSQLNKNPKTITVTGSAEKEYTNQLSSYYLTLEFHNADKARAVDQLSQKTDEAVNKIKEFGIDEKDIKTQSLNVYQRQDVYYDGTPNQDSMGDWYASYSVEIILRDISKSVQLTSLLTSIEDSSMWGPNLTVDDSKYDYDELLVEAIGMAREKADKLAKSMGGRVGKVISVDEGVVSGGYYGIAKEDMAMGGGGGFPIEPGTSNISRTVTVTFELK